MEFEIRHDYLFYKLFIIAEVKYISRLIRKMSSVAELVIH